METYLLIRRSDLDAWFAEADLAAPEPHSVVQLPWKAATDAATVASWFRAIKAQPVELRFEIQ